jgi:hypothetical protein
MENEVSGLRAELRGVNASLESQVMVVNTFLDVHQKIIEDALQDNLGTMANEFVRTLDVLQETKAGFNQQVENTMQLLQEKVRLEMQNLLSAQSLENGFI